jgi:hypothetical protein
MSYMGPASMPLDVLAATFYLRFLFFESAMPSTRMAIRKKVLRPRPGRIGKQV